MQSNWVLLQAAAAVAGSSSSGGGSANMRCLCSPTGHPGSFRCRLHRSEYVWVGRMKTTGVEQ